LAFYRGPNIAGFIEGRKSSANPKQDFQSYLSRLAPLLSPSLAIVSFLPSSWDGRIMDGVHWLTCRHRTELASVRIAAHGPRHVSGFVQLMAFLLAYVMIHRPASLNNNAEDQINC